MRLRSVATQAKSAQRPPLNFAAFVAKVLFLRIVSLVTPPHWFSHKTAFCRSGQRYPLLLRTSSFSQQLTRLRETNGARDEIRNLLGDEALKDIDTNEDKIDGLDSILYDVLENQPSRFQVRAE